MPKEIYADNKPKDCKFCYFWRGKNKGCCLGKENCYYLVQVAPKSKSECDDCPYGKCGPCIGWCTKKILKEVGVK